MKKILFCVAALFTMISCLDGGSFRQSYVADITFEFSKSAYASYFKDSLYIATEGEGFTYMDYPILFSQKQMAGSFQGGFLMSYLKGESHGVLVKPEDSHDAYRVWSAAGADNSTTYAVYYENPVESMRPKYDIEFGYKEVGACNPLGCYVNNTTLVARKVKEHFKDGDKLILKAKGILPDGTVKQTSIVLAEYTEAKDSVMYSWTPFSLSVLGTVDYVDFEVVSTNPDVPGYFCLDGYLAAINVEY
jgi:hypothetical protein